MDHAKQAISIEAQYGPAHHHRDDASIAIVPPDGGINHLLYLLLRNAFHRKRGVEA